MTTRTTEPTQITQGERIAWTKSISDYSAALYTLEYRFRHQTKPGFNVTATADGAAFDAVITAAISAAAGSGVYVWQAWLTEIATATNTFPVASGRMMMRPGFTTSGKAAADLRTPAKIMLDTLDAALLAAGSADMIEYEISTPAGSRRVKREARKDVIEQRKYWAGIVANEIARERMKNGGPVMPSIRMRVHDV